MRGTKGTWVVAVSLLLAAPAGAQVQWSTQADADSCEDRGRDSDRESWCELRAAVMAAPGRLDIEAGNNGSVEVVGSDRRDVQIRAHVWANAPTEARAREIVEDVELSVEGGRLMADGPTARRREYWGVSWELAVPRATDLDARTMNGGIAIEDVSGDIEFDAMNGGIRLVGVGGDVRGRTMNGGLHVELAGSRWEGRGLDAETTNGGVTLVVPDGYGAELETGTVNGSFDIDFPITVRGRLGRTLRTTLGSGGPPVRALTTNGGVRIRRR
jgi:hypothetical protein